MTCSKCGDIGIVQPVFWDPRPTYTICDTCYGMKNYVDKKCTYGYMTICANCLLSNNVPKHIDKSQVVLGFPVVRCELCKRKKDGHKD